MKDLPILTAQQLGEKVPRRGGTWIAKLAQNFLNRSGWKIVGDIPNIPKAVILAAPHTSNIDGVYAIPTLLALDADIKLMGKKQLFQVPVLAQFLKWAGVIAIDREKKGSTLQASIDRFKHEDKLFLGLAAEGTRKYTKAWKTGFYYIALGANVPILPVAMDYARKEVQFLAPFYPTGDIDQDLAELYQRYAGVMPKHPQNLSQPLQDVNQHYFAK
ncbi:MULTISPECIES: lysophospholipid acyltransferase family protein [unclassified Acinetobacter]|uniref:lysophospholipid acyltransferase family protein n=1 Tax=unclassified Acinetobacter TaxID=196816 RepID=UPI0035B986C4